MRRELTQTEAAYLAGIFDGEGCVMLGRSTYFRPHLRRDVTHYSLQLIVGNTHRAMLEWILERVGGALYALSVVGNRQPAWHWRLGKRHAAAVLHIIRPYAIVKARQIDLALEFISLGRSFVPSARAEMYEQMRGLNARGASKGTAAGAASVTNKLARTGAAYAFQESLSY